MRLSGPIFNQGISERSNWSGSTVSKSASINRAILPATIHGFTSQFRVSRGRRTFWSKDSRKAAVSITRAWRYVIEITDRTSGVVEDPSLVTSPTMKVRKIKNTVSNSLTFSEVTRTLLLSSPTPFLTVFKSSNSSSANFSPKPRRLVSEAVLRGEASL